MAFFIAVPFFIVFFFFGKEMLSMFMGSESKEAMDTGIQFLKVVSPFYIIISLKLIADGVLRGSGAMKMFMISTFSDLILRVALSYILATSMGILGIWLSWPIGWLVGTIFSLAFYKSEKWKKIFVS